MPELRWILIVAGLLILLAVYLWGRRLGPRTEEKETILRSRAEPLISSESFDRMTPDPYVNEAYALDPDLMTDVAPSIETPSAHVAEPLVSRSDAGEMDLEARREPAFGDDEAFIIDADDEPTITPSSLEDEPVEARTQSPQQDGEPVVEPVTAGTSAAATVTPNSTHAAANSATSTAAPAASRRAKTPTPRKILVLRLAAGPSRIAGAKLRAAFATQRLTFGKYEIFHYVHANGTTLFSVASMVEPGSFDLQTMDSTPYPGVTLFAQLPSIIPGQEVLEELLRHAKQLQAAVGGTLQDERGGLINSPRIERLRQEVAEFEHLTGTQAADMPLTP
jgi:cell division protein ZipA